MFSVLSTRGLLRSKTSFCTTSAISAPLVKGLWNIRLQSTKVALDEYEQKIADMLQKEFNPTILSVRDVSGGCGSMFAIQVESAKFKGIPMVKQHRLVNELLKDEISQWHGLQLKTKASS
ncbi:Altered inheritance of mitochondria protein 1 [Komagataella phaffii CBS 7435]|uniref:Altered inheritance of mitochondria protein 1 n=2 Tax=Komagataella phaffii TaxID=460519 RepID=C4R5B5_KOMPG|nr:uncharacterized protein PAS_chr3_0702 [Komagataella phaffii GS115]AOA63967.1 GQ67_03792T0 [Komagataella phaffii]CAH2449471.1 Altered inheritance of mitochondria protein 1 [Komagataella phaffii CBS 7435]AOA68389.1 GQ68_03764T0 [Komagataella phaffii GS115]CAY70751.1 Putative protein of unknown function [Komagataella phaffii GS115]CCA39458.1 Altered inheritance of mitochondria protein 1 [Komagataella phaffii CBS 7435]